MPVSQVPWAYRAERRAWTGHIAEPCTTQEACCEGASGKDEDGGTQADSP